MTIQQNTNNRFVECLYFLPFKETHFYCILWTFMLVLWQALDLLNVVESWVNMWLLLRTLLKVRCITHLYCLRYRLFSIWAQDLSFAFSISFLELEWNSIIYISQVDILNIRCKISFSRNSQWYFAVDHW